MDMDKEPEGAPILHMIHRKMRKPRYEKKVRNMYNFMISTFLSKELFS
jgi:hypothetical protein